MKIKHIFLSLLLILTVYTAEAQKETFNWHFGLNAGMTFNTPDGTPAALDKSVMLSEEGCGSYSDSSGNLLFYTNGVKVWDKEHNLMKNGFDISGKNYDGMISNICQSIFILPYPKHPDLYYIFILDENFYMKDTFAGLSGAYSTIGFSYSVVDMKLHNGLGEVITKNELICESLTEKITASRYKYDGAYWIILHKWKSNEFFAFSFDEYGLSTAPVISQTGRNFTPVKFRLPYTSERLYGNMRVNTQFNRIAVANTSLFKYYEGIRPEPPLGGYGWSYSYITNSYIEIYNFNNLTGKVLKQYLIEDTSKFKFFYGLEFSPDGSKLYATEFGYGTPFFEYTGKHKMCLWQFDLNKKTQKDIQNSATIIDSVDILGGIQLGPDGKIYVTRGGQSIGVINSPDEEGINCNYEPVALKIYTGLPLHGLPAFLYDNFSLNLKIESIPVCIGEPLIMKAKVKSLFPFVKYLWTGPNNFISNDSIIIIPNSTDSLNGLYHLKVTSGALSAKDSINITIHPRPKATIEGLTSFCQVDSTILIAKPDSNIYKYLWNTKETTQTITVKKAGRYSVIVENEFGCKDSMEIVVTVNPKPEVKISGINEFCTGDSTILSVSPYDLSSKYIWSTGSTSKDIIAKDSGWYNVVAENTFGCRDSASFFIKVHPKPKAYITGNKSICYGESTILKTDSQYAKYQWSTGETTPEILVKDSGFVYVIVENEYGCKDTASCIVKIYPTPDAKILSRGGSRFCEGDSISLYTEKDYQFYKWSTGETSKQIKISLPGVYTVDVIDTNGCRASVSITIDFKDIDLEFSNLSNIIFDGPCVNDSLEKSITLTNKSDEAILINSIFLKNYNDIFSIMSVPALPANINPGDIIILKIKFRPKDAIDYSDSLVLDIIKPCNFKFLSEIKGKGKPAISVWLPVIKGNCGNDNFCIPCYAKLNWESDSSLELTYNAEIRFNATSFLPDSSIKCEIIDGEQVIKMSGSGKVTKNENPLFFICGTVLLADKDTTALRLTDFSWQFPDICTEKQNGCLILTNVCVQSQRRIKLLIGNLLQVYPNPTTKTITVAGTIGPNSNINIAVYNVLGIKKLEFNEKATSGNYLKEINIESFASGFYFVNIRIDGEVYSWSVVKE